MPNIWAALIPIVGIIMTFGTTAWVIGVFVASRREQARIKAMTEFHTRLLDKLSSTQEFVQFLQSDGGMKFVDSLSIARVPVGRPAERIVKAAQAGTVVTALGIGFFAVGGIVDDIEGSTAASAFGVLLIALGVGFLLSSVAAHRLSKQLGLLDAQQPTESLAVSGSIK